MTKHLNSRNSSKALASVATLGLSVASTHSPKLVSLHMCARNNQVDQINLMTSERQLEDVRSACLEADEDGNTPPMVAALNNNKEALLALLATFFIVPDKEDIKQLLHHQNKRHQTLLATVCLHMESLFAAHGILVELEAIAHNWNSYQVQDCFRIHLGSTKESITTKKLYQEMEKNQSTKSNKTLPSKICNFLKLFLTLRIMLFYLTDVISDFAVLSEYSLNKNSMLPNFNCSDCERASSEFQLGCYSCLPSTSRFLLTISLIILPFLLYFFEMLQFRWFSEWLENQLKIKEMNKCTIFTFFKPFKLLSNLFILITWPLTTFLRYVYYCFKYETSQNTDNVEVRSSKIVSTTILSRMKIIEVSTEASLQPLLQVYIVLINLLAYQQQSLSNEARILDEDFRLHFNTFLEYLAKEENLRLFSVCISILTVAASYTSQYNIRKDNSLGIIPMTMFFTYICLSIVARILCFQMFAFYLGPGQYYLALIAIAVHVLLMSVIHFIFSDSLEHCKSAWNGTKVTTLRLIILVVHNSIVNGFANIYTHNNLELCIDYREANKCNNNQNTFQKCMSYEEANYVPPEKRQSTLVRQLVTEIILFVENVTMILVGRYVPLFDYYEDTFPVLIKTIVICYLCSITLKIVFYSYCHPWSTLIRPSINFRPKEDEPYFKSSMIVLGKRLNLQIGGN